MNAPERDLTIGLVGNPNCGKTTLFNALTGARQKVGNWPGVTVDRKSGHFEHAGHRVHVVDLPGIYSLAKVPGAEGIDETIARDWILSGAARLIVNIVDATSLERGLYLTAQLIELGVPMVLAVNMLDEARRFDLRVDLDGLAARLGCPVVGLVARRGEGLAGLKDVVHAAAEANAPPNMRVEHSAEVEKALADLAGLWPETEGLRARGRMIKALEGDSIDALPHGAADARIAALQARLRQDAGDDPDTLIAEGRYAFAHRTAEAVTRHGGRAGRMLSDRIDRVVLHPLAGPIIFLAVLYAMFMVTINLGGAFVDFFDKLAATVFVGGLGALLGAAGAPEWLKVLLADGLGGGVQVVATFIPIIGLLYVFLSALEDSGYMARAAFLVDRYSRRLGLPGKAFVPLVVGFGCNVPAVMAARTLEQHRDRLMTAAMAPFMSCGARLAVYALFASAFFPSGGENLVFALYLSGIAMAVITGLILRHTVLKGEITPFMMELPTYRWPPLRDVMLHAWVRLKGFLVDAGQVIVLVIAVLGFLNSFGTDGSFGNQNSERSALAAVARTTAPLFTPMGVGEDNWPAVVGIVTGIFAKETIVGTLNALYAVADKAEAAEEGFDLAAGLGKAFATIPENLAGLAERLTNPIAVKKGETVEAATLHNMARHFDGVLGAFAYLLFILLYVPCVATIGALKRETGGRWTAFVVLWTTGVAYGVASAVYQVGRFVEHPGFSALWLAGTLALLGLAYGGLRAWGRDPSRSQAAA